MLNLLGFLLCVLATYLNVRNWRDGIFSYTSLILTILCVIFGVLNLAFLVFHFGE